MCACIHFLGAVGMLVPSAPPHPVPTHPHTQWQEEEERPDVQEWERRRRLEFQQEEEKELWGLAGKWGKRLIANAPVFFLLPFVLGAAVQLSGIAVATAVIAALVVASFSLPVFALAFVVPIAVVLLLGTLAFPIIPFAVFTLAPALAVAPLVLFLAWLVLQMGSGPSVIREDSLFNSFGGQWVRLDDDDDDGVDGVVSGVRRRGGRSGGREDQDGVIDVEAEEDTEAEAEAELRRFDERLRRKDGKDGQGRKE